MDPGLRVVSRKVGEDFGGRFVVETSQPGTIVVIDEGLDEGVALGVIGEAVFAGVGGGSGMALEGFGEAAIEALGHAVGLRTVGPGEFVANVVALADLVKGVGAGAAVALAPAHLAAAIGELGAVVGEEVWTGWPKACRKRVRQAAMVAPLRFWMISTWTKRVARSMATKTEAGWPCRRVRCLRSM